MSRFVITKDNTQYSRRFKVSGRRVEFKIASVPHEEDPMSWIKGAVQDIVQQATEHVQPNDMVGFTFCGKAFQERGPGWVNFRPAREITFEDVWDMLARIFQSNSAGLSTDTFCLGVTTVRMPTGQA